MNLKRLLMRALYASCELNTRDLNLELEHPSSLHVRLSIYAWFVRAVQIVSMYQVAGEMDAREGPVYNTL